MSYHPYGGGGYGGPSPGYGYPGGPGGIPAGIPGGMPGGVPGGVPGVPGGIPGGMPMNGLPGMIPPGIGVPPGMAPGMAPPGLHPPATPTLPMGFQPPANLPNINFSARVIRLGTSSKAPPTGPAKEDTPTSAHSSGRSGPVDRTEQSRANAREAAQALIPPTVKDKLRTVFVGNIPEGAGGDKGVETLLRAVGRLKRFDSSAAFQGGKGGMVFGFALFEDAESVAAAVELLKDIEVPTKKQDVPEKVPEDPEDKFEGIAKTKLIVIVDERTIEYLKSRLTDEAAKNARIDSVRPAVRKALRALFYPTPEFKEEIAEASADVEVVNINVAQEDELADIPAEMREMVAGEIAAFRERSNQRDLERMKREEELEERERLRNNGGRARSPVRGSVPTGPRADKSVGLEGSGLSAAELASYREDDTDASDEEIWRREVNRKKKEEDAVFAEAERKWISREKSRTAALEREREREKHDEEAREIRKRQTLEAERDWDDAKERDLQTHPYYRDHANWARKRAMERADEEARNEEDRRAEADEEKRERRDREKAKERADEFLEATGRELAAEKPVAPQPFKLSLGAAAQKAKAEKSGRARRTVAEVEGLLDDEEQEQQMKRQLIPIKFDAVDSMTEEEIQKAIKQLAAEIPTDKEGLWKWKVKWEYLNEEVIREKLRPFVEKKVVEYLGVQDEVVVEVVEEHLGKRGGPGELAGELAEVLEEAGEDLVKKLWRMVIFYSESEKRGLPA